MIMPQRELRRLALLLQKPSKLMSCEWHHPYSHKMSIMLKAWLQSFIGGMSLCKSLQLAYCLSHNALKDVLGCPCQSARCERICAWAQACVRSLFVDMQLACHKEDNEKQCHCPGGMWQESDIVRNAWHQCPVRLHRDTPWSERDR